MIPILLANKTSMVRTDFQKRTAFWYLWCLWTSARSDSTCNGRLMRFLIRPNCTVVDANIGVLIVFLQI